jgi:hypothetical protein
MTATPTQITIGRTMLLSLLGVAALAIAGIIDAIALFWCLAVPDLSAHVPACMTTAAVIVGAMATVTAGGAAAHGIRHLGAAEPGSTYRSDAP